MAPPAEKELIIGNIQTAGPSKPDVSAREVRRLLDRGLHIDSFGRGDWRGNVELKKVAPSHVDPDRLIQDGGNIQKQLQKTAGGWIKILR